MIELVAAMLVLFSPLIIVMWGAIGISINDSDCDDILGMLLGPLNLFRFVPRMFKKIHQKLCEFFPKGELAMKRKLIYALALLLVGAYSTEIRNWFSVQWYEANRAYLEPRASYDASYIIKSLLDDESDWTMDKGRLLRRGYSILTIDTGTFWASVYIENEKMNHLYTMEDLRAIHVAAEERTRIIIRNLVTKKREEKARVDIKKQHIFQPRVRVVHRQNTSLFHKPKHTVRVRVSSPKHALVSIDTTNLQIPIPERNIIQVRH